MSYLTEAQHDIFEIGYNLAWKIFLLTFGEGASVSATVREMGNGRARQ